MFRATEKTCIIAQFIYLLLIGLGRPGADFSCKVIPHPWPIPNRFAVLHCSSLLEVPHLARQHNLAYTTNNFTSLKHLYFQTVRARDMKFLDNDHHPLCVRCHMSCVTCHVSNVMCNLSTVTCHLSRVTCHHYLKSVRARDLQF